MATFCYGLNPALFVDLYERKGTVRQLEKEYSVDLSFVQQEEWFARITKGCPNSEDFIQSVRAKSALGFSEIALPALLHDLRNPATQPKERITAAQQLAEVSSVFQKQSPNANNTTTSPNQFQFVLNIGGETKQLEVPAVDVEVVEDVAGSNPLLLVNDELVVGVESV